MSDRQRESRYEAKNKHRGGALVIPEDTNETEAKVMKVLCLDELENQQCFCPDIQISDI